MTAPALTHRLATEADIPAVRASTALSIDQLQRPFLSPEMIAASHAVMGLDTQLIADRTYVVAETEGRLASCGGWSRRATLCGGNHAAVRDDTLLDPTRDPARGWAMTRIPDSTAAASAGWC